MKTQTKVCIIGIGPGNPDILTRQAEKAIDESDCLIGAKRMLDPFSGFKGEKFCSISAEEIACFLNSNSNYKKAAIVVSGDVGFYSAAKKLRERLADFKVEQFCGISSLQYFCAKLGESWEDIKVLSLHGRDENIIAAVKANRKVFFLTGGDCTPKQICETLVFNKLGELIVSVGENLSYPDEIISQGTAEEFAKHDFMPLSVMIIYNLDSENLEYIAHGLDDDLFIRNVNSGESVRPVPMTKSEVRAVSLSKLQLKKNDVVYDIGAGTGSVAIEIALMAQNAKVYAIEKDEAALKLLEKNKAKFSAYNLLIVAGIAPKMLENLPPPDSVFIGGTSGKLKEILCSLLQKNPAVRIVINAITVETVSEAFNCFKELEMQNVQAVQITVSKSKEVGSSHMMMGQNPVMIISAQGKNI